eukprot:scaffold309_cov136-Isochrysis_galbana.AAC.9
MRWGDPVSLITIAGAIGWSSSWAMLCAARSVQEQIEGMDLELCEDRRVLGLSLFGIPAGLLSASTSAAALSLMSVADLRPASWPAWPLLSEPG